MAGFRGWYEEGARECIAKRPLSLYYFERYGWYFSFILYALGMTAYLSNAYSVSEILLGLAFVISMIIPRSPLAVFTALATVVTALVAGMYYVMVHGMNAYMPIAFQPFIAAMTAGILVNMAAYAIREAKRR